MPPQPQFHCPTVPQSLCPTVPLSVPARTKPKREETLKHCPKKAKKKEPSKPKNYAHKALRFCCPPTLFPCPLLLPSCAWEASAQLKNFLGAFWPKRSQKATQNDRNAASVPVPVPQAAAPPLPPFSSPLSPLFLHLFCCSPAPWLSAPFDLRRDESPRRRFVPLEEFFQFICSSSLLGLTLPLPLPLPPLLLFYLAKILWAERAAHFNAARATGQDEACWDWRIRFSFPCSPPSPYSCCSEPRLKFVEHRRGITFFRCLLLLHLLSLLHFLLPSSPFFWWFFGLDWLRFPLTMTMTTFINIWGSAWGLQLGQSKGRGAGQGMLAEWSRQTKQMRFSELPFCRSLVNRTARCALQGESWGGSVQGKVHCNYRISATMVDCIHGTILQ